MQTLLCVKVYRSLRNDVTKKIRIVDNQTKQLIRKFANYKPEKKVAGI